jgi:hypothetical protein
MRLKMEQEMEMWDVGSNPSLTQTKLVELNLYLRSILD